MCVEASSLQNTVNVLRRVQERIVSGHEDVLKRAVGLPTLSPDAGVRTAMAALVVQSAILPGQRGGGEDEKVEKCRQSRDC